MIFDNIEASPHFSEEINENRKVRFSISNYAFSIIEKDRHTFDIHKGTIINRIILNMCAREESVCCVVASAKRKWQEYYDLINDENKSDILAGAYLKEIEQKLSSYHSGDRTSVLIGLNKETFEYLTNESEEALYYGEFGIGKFIINIIEEYAYLPYYERELVLNQQWVELIEDATAKGRKLSVTVRNGANGKLKLDVKPVSIVTNRFSSFSYLVGISRLPGEEYKMASFRLSRILDIKKKTEKSFISHAEMSKVEKALNERGVSYLLGETTKVKVLLSEEGKHLYDTIIAERPSYCKDPIFNGKNWLMEFECTEKQAHDYFWKLGKNAIIIGPESLRMKLSEEFERAADNYKKYNKK